MSVKGWPSQQKLVTNQKTHAEFVTVQPTADFRNGLDAISRNAFRVNSETIPRTAGVGTGNTSVSTGTIIADIATPAMPGDYVRFETGLATGLEFAIAEVSTNSFILATRIPAANLPAPGDTFYIMRYATTRVDATGANIASPIPAPIRFNLDTILTDVSEDTANETLSIPLPVKIIRDLTNEKTYVDSSRLDYSITNVNSAAWTTLNPGTAADSTKITVFDSGGYAMELGIGPAASEARILLIPPGGLNGMIDLIIPAGSRLSVRAIGAALADNGEIDINLLG